MASMSELNIVAAIDFGTTYSGYAFCSKNDFEQQPPVIKTSSWRTGSGTCDKFMKTPTTVLFTQDKKFHSFGFEAEKKYTNLVLRNSHESWYFFRNFKMRLHQKQTEVSGVNIVHNKFIRAVPLLLIKHTSN
jgi:molecular chaperone DnaK (HSP70)